MDVITNETQEQVLPVRTGGDKAMSIISKLLIILTFITATLCLISILAMVIGYNIEFTLKVLNASQLAKLKEVTPIYKTYALYLAGISLGAIVVAIVAKVLDSIQRKKGFGSKLVKVFFILTLVFAGVAILNCVLNYFLFGRYEVIYI